MSEGEKTGQSIFSKLTKKEIDDLIAKSFSISDIILALNLSLTGNNHRRLIARLKKENIDVFQLKKDFYKKDYLQVVKRIVLI